MSTLLVLATGTTDVQLVVDGARHELEREKCGPLHDEFERRGFRLVDSPLRKCRDSVGELATGDLILCTPKLDAVLRYFDGKPWPVAAVIFETRRTLDSDPRNAGAVLERRLRECGVGAVKRCALLTGKEKQEDRTIAQDAVVRREVVERIARALATAFAEVTPNTVVVATTGGLAATNTVIEELVRLHATGNASVLVLEVPDGALAGHSDRAEPENFHPATGFRARWQALTLIENGNLLGAWGAVSHLENVAGQQWTDVVDWLRCFASSLPMPKSWNDEIPTLTHDRMAVRAALRVELALRMGDIPRAVHGTVAFLESALWDHLLEHFERASDSPRTLMLRDGKEAPAGKLLRTSNDDTNCPFEYKQSGKGGRPCFWFHESGAGRFARDYVRSKPLKSLLDTVERIRELRNDVAHNQPTPELMEDARRRMHDARLWSTNGTSDSFLSQTLVQAVLKELGESAPESLLTNLLAKIRCRLVA